MPSPFLGLRKPPLARRRSSRADARQLPLSRLRKDPVRPRSAPKSLPSRSGGTTHRLLYQTHDHHQNAPADSAGSDLTDDRADIEAACPGHTVPAPPPTSAPMIWAPTPPPIMPAIELPSVPRLYCFSAAPATLPPTAPEIS